MISIFTGYFMDLIFGDPYWLFHPIKFIGMLIKRLEKLLRKIFKKREKIGGIVLALSTIGLVYFITYSILSMARALNPLLENVVKTFMVFQILATKSLDVESKKVYYPLKEGNLLRARKFLSYIVGRDTENLSKREIIRATVETIAENISDGIIAPLFYIFLGGAALGMTYKAVNTLDSMVGYKNDKYIDFGWASARIDDIVNYIPARITSIFIVIASAVLGFNYKKSFKILVRDGRNHSSPNAGYPEAAVAGALGIQLGGTNVYFGKPVYKPTIGDEEKSLEVEDIDKTIRIMYLTSFVGICIFALVKFIINF
ncbi:cobalamin biosynthesis protein [Caminicella sporogenes]|uniref:cobalamin biosynthesis protein n=1 Tax=Caminicella sporogenes TaxID=166485 RepID=UPI002540E98D|nr:cobalamin biosynthesis protein [Caminicella sporogenes]WIF94964.1 cobalamin biosynthesis protein [Caminicella sporogenes]